MENRLDLKMVDGNVELATVQVLDIDKFVKRIINMTVQKENMIMQNQNMLVQIENNKKAIESAEANIKLIEADMAKVENFLKSNHRYELYEKAMAEVKKLKEEYEAQQKLAQPNNQ